MWLHSHKAMKSCDFASRLYFLRRRKTLLSGFWLQILQHGESILALFHEMQLNRSTPFMVLIMTCRAYRWHCSACPCQNIANYHIEAATSTFFFSFWNWVSDVCVTFLYWSKRAMANSPLCTVNVWGISGIFINYIHFLYAPEAYQISFSMICGSCAESRLVKWENNKVKAYSLKEITN